MNTDHFKSVERWIVDQIRQSEAGLKSVDQFPDCPMTSGELSKVGRGRRLSVEFLMWYGRRFDRSDMLYQLGAIIDHQEGTGDLRKLAHVDVYDSSDLARSIDEALDDGRVCARERKDMQEGAARNLRNAVELYVRAQRLETGPQE